MLTFLIQIVRKNYQHHSQVTTANCCATVFEEQPASNRVAVKHGTSERGTENMEQQIRNGKTRNSKSYGTVKRRSTILVR